MVAGRGRNVVVVVVGSWTETESDREIETAFARKVLSGVGGVLCGGGERFKVKTLVVKNDCSS